MTAWLRLSVQALTNFNKKAIVNHPLADNPFFIVNKSERVGGGGSPIHWGPSLTSLNMSGGLVPCTKTGWVLYRDHPEQTDGHD